MIWHPANTNPHQVSALEYLDSWTNHPQYRVTRLRTRHINNQAAKD